MSSQAWYLVHSKPQQERTAAQQLERQGFEVFLPRLRHQVRHAGRWREKVDAMFPRYLFVRADTEEQGLSPIRSTVGVSCLVRFGNRPARVPTELITELQARADAENIVSAEARADFSPGERVRIIEGPFAGLEGIIQAKGARERVDLLLMVLGESTRTRVSTHDLASC